MIKDDNFHCRVVVIGDSSVGKTSILNQLIDHTFKPHEQSTIGANYQLFVQEINGVKVEVQIWDTAGQEKFKALGPIYFRNSQGAIAVYDSTNRASFENLESWIDSFVEIVGNNSVIAIAANKCDLFTEIQVSSEEGQSWAESNHYIFQPTSAKTGDGVKELFLRLAEKLLKEQSPKVNQNAHARPRIQEETCSC